MAHEAQFAFVSYCRVDSEFAHRLAEDLKAAGASVWLDQLDIQPGEPWDLAVERALVNCAQLIVVLSPVSVASPNVLDEIGFAIKQKKRIIPVLFQNCDVPFRLHRIHYVDFRTDYARGLRELTKTLARQQQPTAPENDQPERQQSIDSPRRQSAEMALPSGEPSLESDQTRLGSHPQQSPQNTQNTYDRRADDKTNSKATLYVLAACAAVLLTVGGIRMSAIQKHREQLLRVQTTPWAQARYDTDFSDCMNFAPCMEKKTQAERLKQFSDWGAVHYDDPILQDCMSYQPCVQRKAQADRLLALASNDWSNRKPDDPLFKDCMSYQPCLHGLQLATKPSQKKPAPVETEKAPTKFDPYHQPQ